MPLDNHHHSGLEQVLISLPEPGVEVVGKKIKTELKLCKDGKLRARRVKNEEVPRLSNGTASPDPDIEIEEFDEQFTCIMVAEVQWWMKDCKRYSAPYTWYLLRYSAGIRQAELLKNVSLYTTKWIGDRLEIKYVVSKPRYVRTETGFITKRVKKHRRYLLDPWVSKEVSVYLESICRIVEIEGKKILVSPYKGQSFWPWKKLSTLRMDWLRRLKRMKVVGFDVDRLIRMVTHRKTGKVYKTKVLRPHICRHFYLSKKYIDFEFDLKRCQEDIKHSQIKTTSGYVHSPDALGTTKEFLRQPWSVIFGFDAPQSDTVGAVTTAQRSLAVYCDLFNKALEEDYFADLFEEEDDWDDNGE